MLSLYPHPRNRKLCQTQVQAQNQTTESEPPFFPASGEIYFDFVRWWLCFLYVLFLYFLFFFSFLHQRDASLANTACGAGEPTDVC